jgi:hypothetical protein
MSIKAPPPKKKRKAEIKKVMVQSQLWLVLETLS